MTDGKGVLNKDSLIRCIAIASNIMNNPQYFVNNGLNSEFTRDEVKDADDIIKHLGNSDFITIEDFINAMTSEVPISEN